MADDNHQPTLRPVQGVQALWRTQFEAVHEGARWTVDTDFFDFGEKMHLYRDGVKVAEDSSPARFRLGPTPSAGATPDELPRIEAAMSWYGMKRAHLVTPEGEQLMTPAAGTAEAWRAGLERDRPGLSRAMAAVSLLVLLVALVLEVPQLVEWVTQSGVWAQVSDWRFQSPVSLSSWANTALTLGGVAAGLERALRVKHQPWLDD